MPSNNREIDSSNSQQSAKADNEAHALELYREVMELAKRRKKPLEPQAAMVIIEKATDAIIRFGPTNQEKKVELKGIIESIKETMPPGSLEELKKRVETITLRKIHPKGNFSRNFVYGLIAIFLIGFFVLGLRKTLFSPEGTVRVEPSPTPTPQPFVVPTRGISTVPSPSPTSQQPDPSPSSTESPQPSPTRSTPESLLIANTTSVWAKLTYGVQWRVRAMQSLAKGTRFYIEIKNVEERNEEGFYAFDYYPLVFIDQSGNYFSMFRSSSAPEGIKEENRKWYLQAGRSIMVEVDFSASVKGSFSGNILYQNDNRAEPAKFSFTP